MRFSSVIVFAAFALLASTSPIDGHNRRSNSLWRRVAPNSEKSDGNPKTAGSSAPNRQLNRQLLLPPPNDNRDPRPETVILPDVIQNGVRVSHVTFVDGQSADFKYTSTNPWDRLPTHHDAPSEQPADYTFDEIHYPGGFYGRTYRENGLLKACFVSRMDREWMLFFPHPSQHTSYTIKEYVGTHGRVREYRQHFYGPNGEEVLSFQRNFLGAWRVSTPARISWKRFPNSGAMRLAAIERV